LFGIVWGYRASSAAAGAQAASCLTGWTGWASDNYIVDNAYLLVLIKELDTLHAVVMHELNHMLEMEMHAPPNQYYDSSSASIF
jgi:hypothetical protein